MSIKALAVVDALEGKVCCFSEYVVFILGIYYLTNKGLVFILNLILL